jgi:hypothetical protein
MGLVMSRARTVSPTKAWVGIRKIALQGLGAVAERERRCFQTSRCIPHFDPVNTGIDSLNHLLLAGFLVIIKPPDHPTRIIRIQRHDLPFTNQRGITEYRAAQFDFVEWIRSGNGGRQPQQAAVLITHLNRIRTRQKVGKRKITGSLVALIVHPGGERAFPTPNSQGNLAIGFARTAGRKPSGFRSGAVGATPAGVGSAYRCSPCGQLLSGRIRPASNR